VRRQHARCICKVAAAPLAPRASRLYPTHLFYETLRFLKSSRPPLGRLGGGFARALLRPRVGLDALLAKAPEEGDIILPPETCPVSTEGWTRRVQLVRRDGRDVFTLYGREGGGVAQRKRAQRKRARARPDHRQSRRCERPVNAAARLWLATRARGRGGARGPARGRGRGLPDERLASCPRRQRRA
jgi:hypothetical protein